MVDLTILELNLEGAEFIANAPLSGEKGEKSGLTGRGRSGGIRDRLSRSGSDEGTVETDESGGGPSPMVAVLAVVVTIVAVAVARRLRNSGGQEPEPEAEGRLRSIR